MREEVTESIVISKSENAGKESGSVGAADDDAVVETTDMLEAMISITKVPSNGVFLRDSFSVFFSNHNLLLSPLLGQGWDCPCRLTFCPFFF